LYLNRVHVLVITRTLMVSWSAILRYLPLSCNRLVIPWSLSKTSRPVYVARLTRTCDATVKLRLWDHPRTKQRGLNSELLWKVSHWHWLIVT